MFQHPISGKWGYVIDVNAPGAPRRQHRVTTFRSEAEATRALEAVRLRLSAGRYQREAVPTLAVYLEGWLDGANERLRPVTVDKYRSMLQAYVCSRDVGATRLDKLDAAQFDALYRGLLNSGRKGRRSPTTVRQLHAVLRKALGDAVRRDLIWENPVARSSVPAKARTPEQRFWSAPELALFLDVTAGDTLHALFWVAAYTGLRRGELAALRWDDIDLVAGALRVRSSLTPLRRRDGSGGAWFVLSDPKTRQGRRSVSLDSGTLDVLTRHQRDQQSWREAVGVGYASGGWVFANEHGDPYRPDSISRAFTRAVARAQRAHQLPDLHFHGLRHTHATVLLAAGVDPKVVSERLGHSTVAFTLDTYVHTLPSQQRDAIERFARSVADSRWSAD